jgi:starch-binding outer membrane protein, SusD/RagB family
MCFLRRINMMMTFATSLFLTVSCDSFLDVDPSNSKVTTSSVFKDDNTATSAMYGVYYDLASSVISSGEVGSMSRLAGLSADELIDSRVRPAIDEFLYNNIKPENTNISSLWNALYKVIYEANSVIHGVEKSETISVPVKRHLVGEAMFVRAFCYFYLINFFGDVPIITTIDYRVNSSVSRKSVSEVNDLILSDLTQARSLLTSEYVGDERTRPNSLAATALLAKVYLLNEEWEKARDSASTVINNPLYELVQDLDGVFVKESHEAIWQIAPLDNSGNTNEALYYVITTSPRFLVLRKEFVDSLELMDERKAKWIGSVSVNGSEVYYPHKYTLQDATLPASEYSAVFRLAEQYLIRAEAKAMLDDLEGAISDLDIVRLRAGLSPVDDIYPSIDRITLLRLIEDERRAELFTEWGNRWFDLKRANRTIEVLGTLKEDFSINDNLYPIPQIERSRNPQLGDQNEGY